MATRPPAGFSRMAARDGVEEVGLAEPESPWRKSGFQVRPGFWATACAAAKAKWFEAPTTKRVEDVARVGTRVARVEGRRRRGAMASARREAVRAAAESGRGESSTAKAMRMRSPTISGHELLEPAAVVVLDEVAVELVGGPDLEAAVADRDGAQRREPALVEIGRRRVRRNESIRDQSVFDRRMRRLRSRALPSVFPRSEARKRPPAAVSPGGSGSLDRSGCE